MSCVGPDYKYDLFVSYSHGLAVSDPAYDNAQRLRAWTIKLVKELTYRLRIGFADEAAVKGGGFEYYFDDRDVTSGIDIAAEVEAAAKESAVLLVFMSPFYRSSEFCNNEVKWFFEKAASDGRGQDHLVLRMVMPTTHDPNVGKNWPDRLLTSDGVPLSFGEPFHDEMGVPIELHVGDSREPFLELSKRIGALAAEIKRKVERLRSRIQSSSPAVGAPNTSHSLTNTRHVKGPEQELHGKSPEDPEAVLPQLYLLRASCEDEWQHSRQELQKVAIVRPSTMERDVGDLSLLRTYTARRREALTNCQALVLLRCKQEDPSEALVAAGYDDRRTLKIHGYGNVPWVLVDTINDGTSHVPDIYRLPKVPMNEPDWPNQVLKICGLA